MRDRFNRVVASIGELLNVIGGNPMFQQYIYRLVTDGDLLNGKRWIRTWLYGGYVLNRCRQ